MTLSYTLAWSIAIGATAFLYFLSLTLIFPIIRARNRLRSRWEHYKGNFVEKWDKSSKVNEERLRSLRVESKFSTILAHPYLSFKTIEHLLYRSGIFPNLKNHIAAQVFSIIIITEFLFIIFRFPLIYSSLLALFISLVAHFFFLKVKEVYWKRAFLKLFPLSLDIINRGLKSGLTLGRGIAMVSEEVEDPVGNEFNYMASQLQLGISPDDALAEAAARIGINEFRFFSLALIIQREMGGSLADILGKLSEVIRERERFRMKVWTLSSESRATALIVGLLPVFLGITIELVSPGYVKFFFVDPKGKIMLGICGLLSLMGFLVITRLMNIEE